MIEHEILEKVYSRIFEEHAPVIKTGFADLDIFLSGAEKSSLITIGARPAMGKTSFMTNLMLNLLEQNKKCLYFSLEMSTEQLVKRLLGQIAEVDSLLLNSYGEISKRMQSAEKVASALEKLSKYDITIVDAISGVSEIKEYIEKNKPDFVFIDYLQLINVNGKKTRTEAVEDVMLNLKKTASENDCMVFITSQLSRAVENRLDKRPMLSDLRESGGIENISDVVMFIYRDEYYNFVDYDDYPNNKGTAEIIVAKNKYGTVGTVRLLFRSAIMKFLEPVRHEEF